MTSTATPPTRNPSSSLPRTAGLTFAIQIGATAAAFAAHLVLVKVMGQAQYGLYAWVVPWTGMVAVLAPMGLNVAALRLLPKYALEGDRGNVRAFVRFGVAVSLGVSVAVGLIVAGGSWEGWRRGSPFAVPLLIGAALFPLFALTQFQTDALRAMKRILGPLLFVRLFPALALLGVALVLRAVDGCITVLGVLGLTGAMMLLAAAVLQAWLSRRVRLVSNAASPDSTVRPTHQAPAHHIPAPARRGVWFSTSSAMFVCNLAFGLLSFSDMMLLPLWLGPEKVAVYGMAQRIAAVAGMVLMAVNTVAAPHFAEFHARGDREGLQRYVSHAAHWLFWPTLALSVVIVAVARPLLGAIGPDFRDEGWLPLVILVSGQLVNVGAGSVGYLMLMTGHHVRCAVIFSLSAAVNIALQALFVRWWGILGVASATALTMATWNLWLHGDVARRAGVRPSIVSALMRRGRR
ncbi:MAG: oligosaccharide flippase family protein [Planctomycetota bacterium]|nr:oligosaccharide flippase family protein [Planctomycetota bacterium]